MVSLGCGFSFATILGLGVGAGGVEAFLPKCKVMPIATSMQQVMAKAMMYVCRFVIFDFPLVFFRNSTFTIQKYVIIIENVQKEALFHQKNIKLM